MEVWVCMVMVVELIIQVLEHCQLMYNKTLLIICLVVVNSYVRLNLEHMMMTLMKVIMVIVKELFLKGQKNKRYK